LSRQYGILNISQPSRHSRPVTGIASLVYFLFYLICSISYSVNLYLDLQNTNKFDLIWFDWIQFSSIQFNSVQLLASRGVCSMEFVKWELPLSSDYVGFWMTVSYFLFPLLAVSIQLLVSYNEITSCRLSSTYKSQMFLTQNFTFIIIPFQQQLHLHVDNLGCLLWVFTSPWLALLFMGPKQRNP
jgi:hypothetical protein